MNKIRQTAAVLAAVAAAGTLSMLSAAPAGASTQAAEAAPSTTAACNQWITGTPVILSGTLAYAGYTFCSNYPTGYESYLQRKTTFGWKTLQSRKFRVAGGVPAYGSVQSDCDGIGTKTYRHYSAAQNAAGTWQYHYSPEVKLTC
ncbi:hypothetical protein [Amycolatopsis sp. H20-H5]|uniref:hypothetical protein n=1 Tax=Amycolatopsis sp. H20-H5 TaxID=3046309 RepID=UPI002DBA05F1|nr:hypothetical protein [Amycolatopsis sp. H20-H5]MEC3976623.1 hypothetical protein [Amycolatopsis sp. H20-H5]